jgi:hypothetical protein
MACSGGGRFLNWLTLASSHFMRVKEADTLFDPLARRVLDLSLQRTRKK